MATVWQLSRWEGRTGGQDRAPNYRIKLRVDSTDSDILNSRLTGFDPAP